jgi:hypothetical protein
MINRPIYIGGVSYSGKTQLRLLLSRLPNIVITRRTYLWRKYYQKYGDLSVKENFDRCLSDILKNKHIQSLNPDPDRIRKDFGQGDNSYSRLFSLFHIHYAETLGKNRWGIQIGMVEKDADLIFAKEPNAQIIHVIRNPLDRIEESLSTTSRKKLSLGWETNIWRDSSRYALQNLEKYPNHYRVIKWENLLKDMDGTLQVICNFLEEEYHPEIIKMEGLEEMGLVEHKDSSNHFRQLEKKETSNSYQLSNNDRAFIFSHAKLEMQHFGYEVDKIQRSFIERIKFVGLDYPGYSAGVILRKSLNQFKSS